MKQLSQEIHEQIIQKYARVVKWKDMEDKISGKLKICPVVMIPYKNKKYRCIIKLSFKLYKNGNAF
jgi:hypothetical protein